MEVTRAPLELELAAGVLGVFVTGGLLGELLLLFVLDEACFEVDGVSETLAEDSTFTGAAGCAKGAGLGHTAANFLLALSFFFLDRLELASLEERDGVFLLFCCRVVADVA